jgi:hypothetical protein
MSGRGFKFNRVPKHEKRFNLIDRLAATYTYDAWGKCTVKQLLRAEHG